MLAASSSNAVLVELGRSASKRAAKAADERVDVGALALGARGWAESHRKWHARPTLFMNKNIFMNMSMNINFSRLFIFRIL